MELAELLTTAARKKYRFDTVRGQVTVEDLWDMPLTGGRDNFNLDTLAIQLDEAVDTKSFVKRRTSTANVNQHKLDIVKHVIDTKVAELDAAEVAAANKVKKEKLLAALASKEEQKFVAMSEEDIRKELATL